MKKILIVDDEKDVVDFLSKNLTREGYYALGAYDGIQAKEKVLTERPDVIILDIVMPRLDGWGFLEWLRKEAKLLIPTIVVSAKKEIADMQQGYAYETNTYLVKPINIDDVLKAIQVILALEIKSD